MPRDLGCNWWCSGVRVMLRRWGCNKTCADENGEHVGMRWWELGAHRSELMGTRSIYSQMSWPCLCPLKLASRRLPLLYPGVTCSPSSEPSGTCNGFPHPQIREWDFCQLQVLLISKKWNQRPLRNDSHLRTQGCQQPCICLPRAPVHPEVEAAGTETKM